MKKTRHTEEQIAFAHAGGDRHVGVGGDPLVGSSEQTFYRWKKVYDGLGLGERRRLKQLEDENRKLKQLVSDLSLDKHILLDVLARDVWSAPSGNGEMRFAAQSA